MDEIETLGKFLRRERESKKVSLRELSKNTRVREQILKAIEEDRYDLLPPRTFVKGFLTAYAKYIGLDTNEILLRYEQGPIAKPDSGPSTKPVAEISRKTRSRWSIGLAMLGGVVVAVLILYFFYPQLFTPRVEPGISRVIEMSPQLTEKPPAAPAVPPGSAPVSPAAPAPPAPSATTAPISTPAPAPPQTTGTIPAKTVVGPALPGINAPPTPSTQIPAEANSSQKKSPISLQLNAVEVTWLSVKVDTQTEREMMLKPGEKASLEGSNQVYLLIGNAGGVELIQNGERLEKFGKSGEVVALTFTPQGVDVKRFEKTNR